MAQDEENEGGAPDVKGRPSSETQFPYYDLKDAVTIARTLRERAGGICDRAQLAALLGHKGTRSGAFLSRVSAAKMYGLIEQGSDGKFRVTRRGQDIIAPVSPEAASQAKVDAFLSVELFRKVYEEFEGRSLPAEAGLRNLFERTYGVVESRVAPTVRILMDSAEEAGLFEAVGNRSRMVLPLNGGARLEAVSTTTHGERAERSNGDNRNAGPSAIPVGVGATESHIDPALAGLLRRLPAAGTPLSAKKRTQFIDAFTATINFIYPESDETADS